MGERYYYELYSLLSNQEVEDAESQGATIISLGNRLLRSDTAGIALAAVLMYELGDFGK